MPRRVLRAAGYVLFLVLAMEGLARLALSSDRIFSSLSSPYDEPSWRLSWLRARSRSFSPSEASEGDRPTRLSFDRHHPERGWSLAPNLRDLPVFDGKKLSSNSRGLRGAREPAIPKNADSLRIALFGDSFTFGEDVSDEETFGHQMERLFAATAVPGSPTVEVLNFGVHGYGHDQMLLYLREALPIYQPDIVILGYVTDDSLRNMTTFRDFAKPRFRLEKRLEKGELVLEGIPVPTPEALLASQRFRSRFYDLLTMAATRLAFRWGNRAAEVDRLTDALLTEIARETRNAGARPVFALLPAFGELGAPDPAPLPAEALVMDIANREKLPCLRLRPLFLQRARLGTELNTVGHWGPREHQLAAAGLVDFLRRENLAP